jgi:hypothetical protein
MNTPHKHAALYAQIALDAAKTDKFYELYEGHYTTAWLTKGAQNGFDPDVDYRRKHNADELLAAMLAPKLTPVDMRVLIGVDCEFGAEGKYWPLESIDNSSGYKYRALGNGWPQCKPRMNHFHYHNGGACPLPDGFNVLLVTTARSSKSAFRSTSNDWLAMGVSLGDIVGYSITGLTDGYCWPWECEQK